MPKYRLKCVDYLENTFYIDTDDFTLASFAIGEKGFVLHYLLGWDYKTTDKLKSCLRVSTKEEYHLLLPGDSSDDLENT